MTYQHACLLMKTMIIVKSFTILLLSCIAIKLACCFSTSISSLKAIPLVGHLEFEDVYHASKDFGNQYQYIPLAVLHPKAVSDIASAIRNIGMMGPHSQLTVAARGRGHSLQGQAQTRHGIVIHMQSLRPQKLSVHSVAVPAPYVEVSGGELHLTVGGTLSNAGISGQAFRHGPQISNVLQLEIVTGKGEILNCSERQNSDLFHGVLGGLGQFGIITRARIALEPAPTLDFSAFSTDQESLISAGNKFDYIEGFVIINRTGLLNNWSLSFTPEDPLQASKFKSDGRTLYCLEVAKYFNLNWSRWDNRTSAVTPEEEIFYLVAILTSAVPGSDGVEQILKRNRRVIEFSEGAGIGLKQYLPHYTTREEWRSHFGAKWDDFVRRKSRYDPLGMLAPGQRIFKKEVSYS